MDPSTSPVAQVDQAFIYITGISLVVLIGVTITMIAFVFKYSRKKNPEPTDIRGNTLLELIWTIVPAAIAISMFYVGWSSYISLRNVPDDAMVVNVQGQMFNWIFTYPEHDIEVDGELVVPVGEAVKLNISATDVLHSLYIPAFRIKMDAVPGMSTYTWFRADKEGTYTIYCAEYCGSGHSQMLAELKIVSREEYEKWLEENK